MVPSIARHYQRRSCLGFRVFTVLTLERNLLNPNPKPHISRRVLASLARAPALAFAIQQHQYPLLPN